MMTRFVQAATCKAATLLGTAAGATTTFQDANIDVEREAIQSEKAVLFRTDIADDLEAEIVSRVTDKISDEGASLSVDIGEV